MKFIRFWALLIVFVCMNKSAAGELADGLYEVVYDGTGVIVQRANHPVGREERLGRLLTPKLGEAELVSQANDNARFNLRLFAAPFEGRTDRSSYALVIGGQCIGVSSISSAREDGWTRLGARFEGEQLVKDVAKTLGIEPEMRKHPGHGMLVTVHQKQKSNRVGERVRLEMKIENVSEKTFSFYDGGSQRGARNNQFSFVGFDHQGKPMKDIGDPMNFGGMAGRITLEPGDVFAKNIDITNWFKFSEPGSYWITAMYEMELVDDHPSVVHRRVLWNDFAVARCRVRVQPAEQGDGDKAVKPKD